MSAPPPLPGAPVVAERPERADEPTAEHTLPGAHEERPRRRRRRTLLAGILGMLGTGSAAAGAAAAAGVDPKVILETISKFGVGPVMAAVFIYLLITKVLPAMEERAERAEQRMAAMEAHHAATLKRQADDFRWALGEQMKAFGRLEAALTGVQSEVRTLRERLDAGRGAG
jgi:hypothetical protein